MQDSGNKHSSGHGSSGHHHHHILSDKTALSVFVALLVLTGITVAVAHIDLGKLNFVVAMAVATVKATLVGMFFMNLKYDKRENAVIFLSSFLFLSVFMVLTSTDILFRGPVYVKKGEAFAAAAPSGKSKYKKPWIATPELVNAGKQIFQTQCIACHGPEGRGDGPASTALNPKPRNFTAAEGWKNGRKPTMVFKTLKEGLPGSAMGSFASLPSDDRWSLAHYVLSLGPKPEADTAADFAKIGVDPTKESATDVAAKTIPIELAIERMAEKE